VDFCVFSLSLFVFVFLSIKVLGKIRAMKGRQARVRDRRNEVILRQNFCAIPTDFFKYLFTIEMLFSLYGNQFSREKRALKIKKFFFLFCILYVFILSRAC
jgi:hypothetical protein